MKTKIIFLAMAVIAVLFISGCIVDSDPKWDAYNYTLDLDDYSPLDTLDDKNASPEEEEEMKEDEEPKEVDESKASFTLEATEGDLVKIPITTVDPDGDFVEVSFEKPFNDKGLWQTEIGDEGKYLVKVTVSDGKLSTSEFVLVEVGRANRPPTIECPKKITVKEGETVVMDCNIFDVDGDVVIVGYDGWMKTSTKKTTFGDEGDYTVLVRAKDKANTATEKVSVVVKKTNRAPIVTGLSDVDVMEGETVKVNVEAVDPDGDKLDIDFSEPFNKEGEYTPKIGDRGTYKVTVTIDDGEDKVEEMFNLNVLKLNRAPVLKEIKTVSAKEGETVKINVQAFDPDEDDIVISYSGFMDSNEKDLTYNDAFPEGCGEKGCTAQYEVKVTVSDGTLSATQTVVVKVTDRNRPPEFVFG